jgi:hypothetical protein
MDVRAQARDQGFELEERPLRGQWVWDGGVGTTRGGRASSPNAKALSYLADKRTRGVRVARDERSMSGILRWRVAV